MASLLLPPLLLDNLPNNRTAPQSISSISDYFEFPITMVPSKRCRLLGLPNETLFTIASFTAPSAEDDGVPNALCQLRLTCSHLAQVGELIIAARVKSGQFYKSTTLSYHMTDHSLQVMEAVSKNKVLAGLIKTIECHALPWRKELLDEENFKSATTVEADKFGAGWPRLDGEELNDNDCKTYSAWYHFCYHKHVELRSSGRAVQRLERIMEDLTNLQKIRYTRTPEDLSPYEAVETLDESEFEGMFDLDSENNPTFLKSVDAFLDSEPPLTAWTALADVCNAATSASLRTTELELDNVMMDVSTCESEELEEISDFLEFRCTSLYIRPAYMDEDAQQDLLNRTKGRVTEANVWKDLLGKAQLLQSLDLDLGGTSLDEGIEPCQFSSIVMSCRWKALKTVRVSKADLVSKSLLDWFGWHEGTLRSVSLIDCHVLGERLPSRQINESYYPPGSAMEVIDVLKNMYRARVLKHVQLLCKVGSLRRDHREETDLMELVKTLPVQRAAPLQKPCIDFGPHILATV